MKKLLSKITILLIMLSFFIPAFVNAWSDNMNGAWKYAYAYQITIVKYDGEGPPEALGKPILVYHPNLLQDVYYTTNTPMPRNYDDLTNNSWGFKQLVDLKVDKSIQQIYWIYEDDDLDYHDADSIDQLKHAVDTLSPEDFSADGLWDVAKDLVEDKNLSDGITVCNQFTGKCQESKYGNQRYVDYDRSDIKYEQVYLIRPTKDPASGRTGYKQYKYSFITPQRKITYHGKDVNLSKYYKTFSDSNLTESNVNNGYLETLAKRYAGSVRKVKDNFGIDLDYKDIDKYYLSFEPVQRILDGVKEERGTYYITYHEKIILKEVTWNASDWSFYPTTCSSVTGFNIRINEYRYSKPVTEYLCRDKSHNGAQTPYMGRYYYWYKNRCYANKTQLCRGYKLDGLYVGVKIIKNLFGRYADGNSHLETSRKLGSGAVYLNRAVDYCNEDKNKHCVLEDDNQTCKKDSSGNVIYEYYIGPDRDIGITGTQSTNFYKLNGACYNGTGTTGIKHFFLQTLLDCPEVCSAAGEKTSDSFLACAENFCEAEVDYNRKGSPQKAKEACILTCGYRPPNYDKNSGEGTTNCEVTSPYKDINEVTANGTTTCNVNDDGSGKVLSGLIKTCDGNRIDSFDGDDTNDTPFDIRRYVTVACMETSAFEYKDASKLEVIRGTGLNYSVVLNGEKKCQAYFDEDQWKFDYATISGKDPDRRKRLLYIKEVYNHMFDDTYDKTKSAYYDPDFAEQGDGEIDWNLYLYDTKKVSVKSQITESVYGETKQSDLETLVTTEENEKATKVIINNGVAKKISKNNIIDEPFNKYEQVSTVKATYQFDNRCVSNDGLGTVTKAPASGLCYQTKDEHGVVTPVYGQNVFYTNLQADVSGNKVNTFATVGKEVKDDNTYYDVKERCDYTTKGDVSPPSNYLSCDIRIDPVGSTEAWGNSIYHGGDVTATILPRDTLGSNDYISNYTLQVRNTTYDGKTKQIGISDKKLAMEEIKILGTVTSSLGKKGTCVKTIYIINPDENCGVRCNLRKINDTTYELQSTGPQTPSAYYRALSIDMTQRKVYKSVVDQKYYISLDQSITVPIEGNLILFGIVEGTMTTNGQKCKYTCNTPPPTLKSCYALYKPAETLAIRDYCNENWEKDVNDYEDAAQCIRMCSNRCDEEIKRDLEKVTAYCRTNSTALGFSNENICINACYNDDPSRGKDYVYRPINNSNPFPNSYDSEEPNEKGKRLVGRNWAGFTDYIKHDDNDETSVTGVYANQHVEYIIDLSASDIERIQEDTKKNQRDGANPYIEYEYKKSSDNIKYVKKYESKFIHEDFADLFRKDLT